MSAICGASSVSPSSVLSQLATAAAAAPSEGQVASSVASQVRNAAQTVSGGAPGPAVENQGVYLQGIINHLLLKYLGVDFEYYNVPYMQYRGAEAQALQGP